MKIPRKGKEFTKKQILTKLYSFCAYQERSTREVLEKLSHFGLYGEEAKGFEKKLIDEGYLDDERFAKVYAGSKFRIKKWGKRKIIDGLRAKGLNADLIETGLREIDDDSYRETLRSILEKKIESTKKTSKINLKKKCVDFAVSRGFEYDLTFKVLSEDFGL